MNGRAVLDRVSLFRGLPVEALDDIGRRLTTRQVRAGAVICAQRQPAHAVHILCAGRAKVSVLCESGREVILQVLRPGEAFGEMSLSESAQNPSDVVALTPATIASLSRDTFRGLCARYPQIALSLSSELSARLRAANETIVNLSVYEVNDRLVRTLCELARKEGEPTATGLLIRRRPTQQDLASMVGSCRETVSRAFSALQKRGLLIADGRSIVLTPRLVEMGGK
jgi:CRP-like cAMP-binding protein